MVLIKILLICNMYFFPFGAREQCKTSGFLPCRGESVTSTRDYGPLPFRIDSIGYPLMQNPESLHFCHFINFYGPLTRCIFILKFVSIPKNSENADHVCEKLIKKSRKIFNLF